MQKKYTVIVKVSKSKFLKYNVTNLLSFTNFLDKDHKAWRWFNVYDKKTKKQLGSFSKYNKPNKKYY